MAKLAWKALIGAALAFLLFLAYLWWTPPGNKLRLMLGGSILTSQHVKYAHFFLTKKEYDQMYAIILDPPADNAATASAPVRTNPTDTLKVRVDTVTTANYTAKVMVVNDPTAIHLVPSKSKSSGQTLMDIVDEYHAVGGINAGGFYDPGGNSNGGQLIGLAISDGKLLGPVGKNQKIGFCGFTSDGAFITGRYTYDQIKALHVVQAVSFGPQLILDHKNEVDVSLTRAYGWAPRTAIGQDDDGNVIMVITDGRFYFNKHRGASMSDLVDIFTRYHAKNAYALDGGGSTTMILNGQLQMKPATSTRTGMRELPDAFVVIPHEKQTVETDPDSVPVSASDSENGG